MVSGKNFLYLYCNTPAQIRIELDADDKGSAHFRTIMETADLKHGRTRLDDVDQSDFFYRHRKQLKCAFPRVWTR